MFALNFMTVISATQLLRGRAVATLDKPFIDRSTGQSGWLLSILTLNIWFKGAVRIDFRPGTTNKNLGPKGKPSTREL
eukprot:m.127606 g.127606  ORF g.127606 m.127606 type:complete len:78 (-) comp13604_c0_seq1:226-459(-)